MPRGYVSLKKYQMVLGRARAAEILADLPDSDKEHLNGTLIQRLERRNVEIQDAADEHKRDLENTQEELQSQLDEGDANLKDQAETITRLTNVNRTLTERITHLETRLGTAERENELHDVIKQLVENHCL